MQAYLDVILFLKELAAEASQEARANKERSIRDVHIQAVAQVCSVKCGVFAIAVLMTCLAAACPWPVQRLS